MNLILWLIVIAAGILLEAVSFIKPNDKWLPLTYYIRKYVPTVVIAAALVWLARHFDVLHLL